MNLANARALKLEMRARTTAAAPPSFEALRRRRREALPAVAIGIAPFRDGDYRIAIRVREENADALRAVDEITTAARGEVDVRMTGPILAMSGVAPAAPHATVGIGMSVAHFASTAGTLGCFVQGASGAGFISSNHVIALEDAGRVNDDILHPAPADAGQRPRDVIASLVEPYPLLRVGRATVDCAFARLLPNISFDPFTLAGGGQLIPRVATVDRRDSVHKIGRSTGRTSGVVSAFDVDDVVVDYPQGGFSVTFDDQIEIESIGGNFANLGDSGSVVFNDFQEPVALLLAADLSRSLTFANPLQTVLTQLGVALIA